MKTLLDAGDFFLFLISSTGKNNNKNLSVFMWVYAGKAESETDLK